MKRTRLQPEVRREAILSAALDCAERYGYTDMTRDQIGAAAGCSGPTVQYYFATMDTLRRTVMRAAVRTERLVIIAQGLVRGDRQAQRADATVRRRAMEVYQ
jgi:AcrR family transcriptional regulator